MKLSGSQLDAAFDAFSEAWDAECVAVGIIPPPLKTHSLSTQEATKRCLAAAFQAALSQQQEGKDR